MSRQSPLWVDRKKKVRSTLAVAGYEEAQASCDIDIAQCYSNAMNIQLLATKIYIPQSRTKSVRRPLLLKRLNEGLDRKLTLVSVSAGFGKTTLVSDWVSGCGRPVAWLSLDEGDRDATRFLNHLIAALQTITEIGESAVRTLNSQPATSVSIESILTTLLNDIASLPFKFVLVLDDYHAVGVAWIDHALRFLLEHLPQQMHLVIATREDPQLPLSRLRARGHLTELRAADLRFSPNEAVEFLNHVMGLRLTVDEIVTLDSRTEGWITGLQLAALSMQGRKDIPAFIRAFAGDNRYIVDYLVEEVLERQPDTVRSFLLQTAILDRLHGSLCDAVTGQKDSHTRLEALERGNFFIVPLDDKRSWYRYHHLFAEVLMAHLRADQPDLLAMLHLRASMWYEKHGLAEQAIRHALAAADFARAADLIELTIPSMRKYRQESMALSWLTMIPDELIACRPVLSVGYAGMLLSNSEPSAAQSRLRDAEYWLEVMASAETPPAEMVVTDVEEFRRLPATIAMYHAGLSLVSGNIQDTKKYALRLLDLVPEDDQLPRGAAIALLGLASWWTGELKEAHRLFAEGIDLVRLGGAIADAVNGSIALAEIRIVQGRLRQAMRTYERGLQLAGEMGEPEMRGTADLHVGMSELYREFNDLNTARSYLMTSKEQGERAGMLQNRFRWGFAMARILEAQGDLDGALHHLREAEQLYVRDFFPNVRPVIAMKARVWALQGRLGDAIDWMQEQGLSVRDSLHYLREYEHITLARVYMARYRRDGEASILNDAMTFLERLRQAAEEGERTGSLIEILILQALACQLQGDIAASLIPLERAITLAEPEGYVRIFADEGQPMATLLDAAEKRGISPNYTRRLRSVIVGGVSIASPAQNGHGALLDPLSERERDVLRLLATELSGPDMARELTVSLNTLRTHTKNIYDKLQVNNRRAAVRRATELGLI